MSEKAPNSNFTRNEETKNFVTPFAFGVDKSLIGVPLASPLRRLMAILLDLVFVAILANLTGVWFSGVMFFVAIIGLIRLKGAGRGGPAKAVLVVIAVLAAFTLSIQLGFQSLLKDKEFSAVFGTLAKYSEEMKSNPEFIACDGDEACQEKVIERALDGLAKELENLEEGVKYQSANLEQDYELVVSELKDASGEVVCPEQTRCGDVFFQALTNDLADKKYSFDDAKQIYNEVYTLLQSKSRLDDSVQSDSLAEALYERHFDRLNAPEAESKADVSIVAWLQGALTDLGLSFGWAAVYFRALTAWWNGQTIGKKLLGIKVVRIDAQPIDLWESFGRYGGYGAGFSTGLLGFLQIYWDANRQGIQDKISETLVIRQ